MGKHLALARNHHCLTWRNITNNFKSLRVKRHAFRRHHEFRALLCFALAINQRPDGERIAKSHKAIAADHRHHGIRTAQTRMGAAHGVENHLRMGMNLLLGLQLVRKHIEQSLGIGAGIDMAIIAIVNIADNLVRIGEITIMS